MNQTSQNHNIAKCDHSKTYSSYSSVSNKIKLVKETNQVQQVDEFSDYLEKIKQFCKNVAKQDLSLGLTIKQAIDIVLVADRLQIPRLDALRAWKACKIGVIISPNFLSSLLISRDMLSSVTFYSSNKKEFNYFLHISNTSKEVIGQASYKDYIDNNKWKSDSKKAISELALMNALREAFPNLLMGVICPSEVPPSNFSQIKTLLLDFSHKLVDLGSCFLANLKAEVKAPSKYLEKKQTNKAKTLTQSKLKENKEEMFFNLEELECKPSKYQTTRFN